MPANGSQEASDDPRQTIVAFATLTARLSHPYCDRAHVLAAISISEGELDSITSRWTAHIVANPGAITVFENAFSAERARTTPRGVSADGNRDVKLSPERQALREEAALVVLGASEPDPDQTLPIAGALSSPLPFQSGSFHPNPSLLRPSERSRNDADPDATRLPTAHYKPALPFIKGPEKKS